MAGPQKISQLTVEEYLASEELASVRHEYVNGRTFAMTGGSKRHNTISLNIAATMRHLLKGSGCNVFIADVKVRANAANSFYYPDVMVVCGSAGNDEFYTESPTVIFEVLSKSTAGVDRREKLVAYQQISSLQSYLVVHQSRKRVEHYQRVGEDWTLHELAAQEELCLNLNCAAKPLVGISMDEIYADLDYDDGPDLQVREDAEAYAW